MEISPEWKSAISAVLGDPGVTMVIGATDVGKTTFALQLLNAAVDAGIPTAVVDSDTGQSDVGPPAAVSMAMVDAPFTSFKELKARRMYFVGSTTPQGHLVPLVIGTRQMVDEAAKRGAKLIVVDTTGLVTGAVGRKLKVHKAQLLAPRHIVGIEKKREIEAILAVLSKVSSYNVHRLIMSAEARSKSREFRAAKRRTQFFEYFKNADRHIIRLDDIVCSGTLFTAGRPVRWQHYRTIERILKSRVLHAEVVGNGMYIVADCRMPRLDVDGLIERYGNREFTIVCGKDFTNVLVGLADNAGNTIDLGIIEAIDFQHRHISVITPARTVSPVVIMQFGEMRVKPDGTELGRIKPGEI